MADIPADTTTTATFEGDPLTFASFSGEFETFDDRDWVKVSLVAGMTYSFYGSSETLGVGGGDSYLELFDSAGALLASDDDSGVSFNSIISYTAAKSGTYFVGIHNVNGDPGQYCIGVAPFMRVGGGSDADDTVDGGVSVRLVGGKGDDTLNGAHLLGEQGDDTLTGLDSNDDLSGGLGNDTIFGGIGDDLLFGDAGGDLIDGGDGADRIYGGDGGDRLSGWNGDDLIHGGGGADRIEGNDGADTLFGDADGDIITGDLGADKLDGGAGADTMVGGDDNDTYYVDNVGDVVDETGATGADKVYSTITFSLANATHAKGDIENLVLIGTANVNGTGNALANAITGNSGNNGLSGQDGNDSLNGGAGTDKLSGGFGADHLTGGTSADTFIFTATTESTTAVAGRDLILDFSHAQGDKIDLHLIDANGTAIGNQAFHFIGTTAFGHHAGELRYAVVSGSSLVYGDANGDGTADFSVLVSHVTSLQASDFIL